jgi:hypothetical protein
LLTAEPSYQSRLVQVREREALLAREDEQSSSTQDDSSSENDDAEPAVVSGGPKGGWHCSLCMTPQIDAAARKCIACGHPRESAPFDSSVQEPKAAGVSWKAQATWYCSLCSTPNSDAAARQCVACSHPREPAPPFGKSAAVADATIINLFTSPVESAQQDTGMLEDYHILMFSIRSEIVTAAGKASDTGMPVMKGEGTAADEASQVTVLTGEEEEDLLYKQVCRRQNSCFQF